MSSFCHSPCTIQKSISSISIWLFTITKQACTKIRMIHIGHKPRLPKINGSVKNVLKNSRIIECYVNINLNIIPINAFSPLIKHQFFTARLFFNLAWSTISPIWLRIPVICLINRSSFFDFLELLLRRSINFAISFRTWSIFLPSIERISVIQI